MAQKLGHGVHIGTRVAVSYWSERGGLDRVVGAYGGLTDDLESYQIFSSTFAGLKVETVPVDAVDTMEVL